MPAKKTAKRAVKAKATKAAGTKSKPAKTSAVNDDSVAGVWRRIEARLGPLVKRLRGPLPADHPYSDIFDTALDNVWLPDALGESYAVHDGERPGVGVVCPPLRLATFDEACAFALGDPSEPALGPALAAAEKLRSKYATSLRKQRLSSSSSADQVWTLALGEPGHRIALDTGAEWVIEERPDGTVKQLADDFKTWLVSLAGEAAPERVAATTGLEAPRKTPIVDQYHRLFRASNGDPTPYRDFDAAAVRRLEQRLPAWLLAVLAADGLASYADQAIWTCDPDDWRDVAAAWKLGDRVGEVFGRSAFGDLFLWDGAGCFVAAPLERTATWTTGAIDAFFGIILADRSYVSTVLGKATQLRAAQKTHGRLAWDEAYFRTEFEGAMCKKRKASAALVAAVKGHEVRVKRFGVHSDG